MPTPKRWHFYFCLMKKEDCYSIGYISKPHGLKGEVTAVFTEPFEFEEVNTVFLERKGDLIPYFIESFSDRSDKVFLKFEEVNSIDAAQDLKGSTIFLEKTNRPKLKRGEFYNDEIIGFEVENADLKIVGKVSGVNQSGLSRLIEIDRNGKEVLIPVNSPFIKSINKSKRLIKVDLPEGYLDI
jgi:16S rRNA processing protein RimM